MTWTEEECNETRVAPECKANRQRMNGFSSSLGGLFYTVGNRVDGTHFNQPHQTQKLPQPGDIGPLVVAIDISK